MRTVLSISLPEGVASELEEYTRSTGRNKSDIVKESLRLYLWDVRLKQVRKSVGAKARKVGIVADEDVFRIVS